MTELKNLTSTVSTCKATKEERRQDETQIGVRESVPRQVDRESRGPQGERGLEFSRRKKGHIFFFLHIP